MYKKETIPLNKINIKDDFWSRYLNLIREKVIPYQWNILNDLIPEAKKSHCIKNFEIAAGLLQEDHYGMVFQDSDLYKWLESVGYSLATKRDDKLEEIADELIDLIEKAQQPDGYINTYYTCKARECKRDNKKIPKQWSNLQEGHELYCAGHFIESAVAYYYATGKKKVLDIACKFADCIDSNFGLDEHKKKGYPGHQEIELALFKLYKATNEKRYLLLAKYFIDERGKSPNYFDLERMSDDFIEIFPEISEINREYSQSLIEPRNQTKACGHSVRALYMYSSMIDLAEELNDIELINTCKTIYKNISEKQMYITGGVGSSAYGESFTTDYHLPNESVYAETCASIGLTMFSHRMALYETEGKYIDNLEKALYNTIISGISLSGTEFFYVNPLEVVPKICENTLELGHVKTVRQKWFSVACCPPNIARTLMSIGQYIYAKSNDSVFVNLFVSSDVKFKINNNECSLDVITNYPYEGTIKIKAKGGKYKIVIHSPINSPIKSISYDGSKKDLKNDLIEENGFFTLEDDWQDKEILIELDLKPIITYCNTNVQSNIGKAVIQYGPFVYCAEEVDNGDKLGEILLEPNCQFKKSNIDTVFPANTVVLETDCKRISFESEELYTTIPPKKIDSKLVVIPYHLWANRGKNEMLVYLGIVT